MEINTVPTYIAIAVMGLMISFLYYLTDGSIELTLFSLFVTVYTLALTRFMLEWRHYRRHGAILASSQFLILPFIVSLTGFIISAQIDLLHIFDASLYLRYMHISFQLNLVSLLLIPPIIVLWRFFYFYNARRWLGFAIHRKLFSKRLIPYIFQLSFSIILIITGVHYGFDIIGSLTIITFVVHTFKYYIKKLFKFKRRSSPLDSIDNALSNRRSLSQEQLNNSRYRRLDLSETETKERKRRRNIPTTPSSGYRTISARSSSQREISVTQTRRQPSRPRSPSRRSVAEISPGRDVVRIKGKTKSISNINDVLPHAHISADDLKCIICYEAFKETDNPIVLCPHCKFPAHEHEFIEWSQASNLCARCSKPIDPSYVSRPKYRYSARDYINKVIKKV